MLKSHFYVEFLLAHVMKSLYALFYFIKTGYPYLKFFFFSWIGFWHEYYRVIFRYKHSFQTLKKIFFRVSYITVSAFLSSPMRRSNVSSTCTIWRYFSIIFLHSTWLHLEECVFHFTSHIVAFCEILGVLYLLYKHISNIMIPFLLKKLLLNQRFILH